MKRRDFIKFLGLATGGLMGFPALAVSSDAVEVNVSLGLKSLAGIRREANLLWVPKGQEKEQASRLVNLLEQTTDFAWLKKGDRVLVKLALNSGNPFPATSDPWALRHLIRLLFAKGAGEVMVGDQSGIASVDWRDPQDKKGSSRELCRRAGLLTVIEEEGAKPLFFEELGREGYFQSKPEGNHHWPGGLWLSKAILMADHLVYLPRVGSHVLGEVTAALKLGVGFLQEESRGDLHRGGEHFPAMYEEIHQVPEIQSRLRLILTSGRKVLSTMGPDTGSESWPEQGLVFASKSLLASELLAYAWLEFNRLEHTSWIAKSTLGRVKAMRSFANRRFVGFTWGGEAGDIPDFVPGRIFEHPAILNRLQRLGGLPERILLNPLEGSFEEGFPEYLQRHPLV